MSKRLIKGGWLPSLKYTEYVVKITKFVISPEVQFQRRFLNLVSTALQQRLVLLLEL